MAINKIIIVGGGSAGWMTATTLIKFFPKKDISLIESPTISTVGVGESTLGAIRGWQAMVGIKDSEFMKACDASYKLSIKFTDFYKKGEAFHYPFGDPVVDQNESLLNDWWFKKMLYPKTPSSDFADCTYPQMSLVNQNKCFLNEKNEILFEFHKHTAFHFDATKFGIWLRDNACIPKGVKHIKEDINTIEQDDDGIKSLNKKHKADLFIDCTGFKSLLLDKTLKEKFNDMTNLLPNDSAWATRIPYKNKEEELVGYTNCTAIENGWVWRIPLWSRIGSGYVYSSKFVDDDTALKQFQKHLKTKELDFRKIKMRVGIHNRLWVKNVCAIGLSAGFIEPLESNGLFSVHEFLHHLVRTLDRGSVSQWDKDVYTNACKTIFYGFADFVAMHYALSHRQDTNYWKANFNKQWSDKVINLLYEGHAGFLNYAVDKNVNYRFTHLPGGIHSIAAGMNWAPTNIVSLIKGNLDNDMDKWKKTWKGISDHLTNRKIKWDVVVKDELSLYKFLKKHIYDV